VSEEKKGKPQEPTVPPVTPVVIEVTGDAEVTSDTPGVQVIRRQ